MYQESLYSLMHATRARKVAQKNRDLEIYKGLLENGVVKAINDAVDEGAMSVTVDGKFWDFEVALLIRMGYHVMRHFDEDKNSFVAEISWDRV